MRNEHHRMRQILLMQEDGVIMLDYERRNTLFL